MMRSNGCELGFAFDGDCDRVAVLERGRTLDNDRLLLRWQNICPKMECSERIW